MPSWNRAELTRGPSLFYGRADPDSLINRNISRAMGWSSTGAVTLNASKKNIKTTDIHSMLSSMSKQMNLRLCNIFKTVWTFKNNLQFVQLLIND
jgi:hypothetical protein